MPTTLKASAAIQILDGAVSTVDREFIYEYEITGKVEGDYWLDTVASEFTLCIKGTDTTGLVDPFVVGLSTIRGIAVNSEINLEITIDGSLTSLKVAEGHFMIAQAEMQTVKISRDDTRTGQIDFIVWGDR